MNDVPTIGILGGMGPYSEVELMRHIRDHTLASADCEHLPITVLSLPDRIPERNRFVLNASTHDPAPLLLNIARRLADGGATVIGIPCNTAHAPSIFTPLTEGLAETHNDVRLLHIVDETARFISTQHPDLERVGILSTLAVYRLGLYASALIRAGIEPIAPETEIEEELVNPAIYDAEYGLKARPVTSSPRARRDLLQSINHLKERGAQAVILGCTELPLAIKDETVDGMRIINPSVALARALIEAASPTRLRPLEPPNESQ